MYIVSIIMSFSIDRYGGIHLGPDRFKHINNVARVLLQHTGIGSKVLIKI